MDHGPRAKVREWRRSRDGVELVQVNVHASPLWVSTASVRADSRPPPSLAHFDVGSDPQLIWKTCRAILEPRM